MFSNESVHSFQKTLGAKTNKARADEKRSEASFTGQEQFYKHMLVKTFSSKSLTLSGKKTMRRVEETSKPANLKKIPERKA